MRNEYRSCRAASDQDMNDFLINHMFVSIYTFRFTQNNHFPMIRTVSRKENDGASRTIDDLEKTIILIPNIIAHTTVLDKV